MINNQVTLSKRNPDHCSNFRAELIAIEKALKILKTLHTSEVIWFLVHSKSTIQHLKGYHNLMDKTSLNIFKFPQQLTSTNEINLQWIPLHVEISSNETADSLVKEGNVTNTDIEGLNLSSKFKSENRCTSPPPQSVANTQPGEKGPNRHIKTEE